MPSDKIPPHRILKLPRALSCLSSTMAMPTPISFLPSSDADERLLASVLCAE